MTVCLGEKRLKRMREEGDVGFVEEDRMRTFRIQGLTMGVGGLGDDSQPKARTSAASQKPDSLHLLLSVMPSCQGLSVPMNEGPSTSSHRAKPGPFLPQFTPPKSKVRHLSARHSQ